jgi:Tfp pilus assembly protein FimT
MVVVAVLGILLAVALPNLSDFVYRQRLHGIADELVSDMALMRAEAAGKTTLGATAFMQIGNGSAFNCYSIYIDDDTGGTRCDCLKPAGSACTSGYRKNPEIKTVAVPASLGVQFSTNIGSNRVRMDSRMQLSWQFRVRIQGNRPAALRVDFDRTGRSTRCSPGGLLAGVPACP